jgi:isopentenyl-diphosphate Delta-isomerase
MTISLSEPLLEDQVIEDQVILVDQSDRQIGTSAKMAAHYQGLLHRAFSIFVINQDQQILLQKRAVQKYHSGGLWTNTCCSHPRPGETTIAAANRRLQEEMGFSCELTEIFSFTYSTQLDQGLSEHEYDHVFLGSYDQAPILNPAEAEDWRWIAIAELQSDIEINPDQYTFWLKNCIARVADYLGKNHAGN